jgi:uracil-DNA glycosylase family 4
VSLEERAKRERALGRAAQLVANCRKCEIGYTRTNPAYGEGDPCARLMLIGEGPGETEDRLGRPFVGRAGELLDKMMGAIGLAREEIYICNTVKCRPTFDDGVRLRNRAPTPDEMRNCRPYLDQQIDIVKPEVILCLGSSSAKSFLGDKFSITKQRGIWFEGPNGIPLIATFHPAYILRMTGGQDLAQVKRFVWSDLKKVRARLDEPKPKPPPDVIQEALF